MHILFFISHFSCLFRPSALFFLCFSTPAHVAFGWITKKTEDHKIKAVDRRHVACCTCRLDRVDVAISSRLLRGGGRPFSFSVVWWRKTIGSTSKTIILKSMMLAIHAHSPKLWANFNALFWGSGGSLQLASYTVQSRKTKSQNAFCWNHRTWTLLKAMRSCFNKTSGYVFGLQSKPRPRFPLLASDLGKTNALAMLMNVSVE